MIPHFILKFSHSNLLSVGFKHVLTEVDLLLEHDQQLGVVWSKKLVNPRPLQQSTKDL